MRFVDIKIEDRKLNKFVWAASDVMDDYRVFANLHANRPAGLGYQGRRYRGADQYYCSCFCRILYGHEKVVKREEHGHERDEGELPIETREEHRKEVGGRLFEKVKENLEKSDERCRKIYSLRHKKFAPAYRIGQTVLERNFRQSSTMEHYNAKYGPLYTPCTYLRNGEAARTR